PAPARITRVSTIATPLAYRVAAIRSESDTPPILPHPVVRSRRIEGVLRIRSGGSGHQASAIRPDPSGQDVEHRRDRLVLRALVGGQDHAQHLDALLLGVRRPLTGLQAVREV